MSDEINNTLNYPEQKLSIWRRPGGRESHKCMMNFYAIG
jgi:hypothetical protein